MTPAGPQLARGTVWHRRTTPRFHAFTKPSSMILVDPDDVASLCALSPLWSTTGPALARWDRRDYGCRTDVSLGTEIRDLLEPVLGRRPVEVRTLTQPRRLGWLFNPITLHLAWTEPHAAPVGAVAEVTNTPWKERHQYPLALDRVGDTAVSVFDKTLHVSPFLDESQRYVLHLRLTDDRVALDLDAVDPATGDPVVETRLRLTLDDPTRSRLAGNALRDAWATVRVSAGIHVEAARLLARRIPFVPHPRVRADAARPDATPEVHA